MLDSAISENYEEKRKSESLKKLSIFYLNSSTFNEKVKKEEPKKTWKKDSKTINNSILSLHIEAYENSIKAAPHSFDVKNNKALTKEKFGSNDNQEITRQIFAAVSKFVFQVIFKINKVWNTRGQGAGQG